MVTIAAENLSPIVAEIAAPAATVYGLLSLELPNTMVHPLPDSSPDGLLAQIDGDPSARWRSVEVIIPQPPDSVTYRLVRGPCSRLERHFHIRERNGHSRVLVEGFWAPGGVFGRLNGHKQVTQATRSLLATVQQQAERLARVKLVGHDQPHYDEAQPDDDPVLLQRRLLLAVEQQERVEYGTAGHGNGTSRLASYLATSLRLPAEMSQAVELAGVLHDVGKTKIEQHLFDRTGILSATGQRRLEQHPQLGAALVLPLPGNEILIPAIRHHHERWDGTGYPDALAGPRIPLVARIIAIAEAADAMQRPLPDRRARSPLEVATILERHAGRQWDPDLAHRLAAILSQGQEMP